MLAIQGRSDEKQFRLERVKLEEQNRGDPSMLTVWKIENKKTEIHHLILLILIVFDTV